VARTDGSYIPFVDGLRAVAVLAVIAYHMDSSWLPGGFMGVDVFFVISGFVISGSLAHAKAPGLGEHLGSFYARRLRRIAPALIVCLVGTAIAAVVFVPEAWVNRSQDRTGLMAFFGLSNFELVSTIGYFEPAATLNPYTHTWSLGVEEQFYLIFPLVFFAWVSARRRLAFALVGIASAASLAYAAARTSDTAYSFYMLPTRFWELGAGALLLMLLARRQASEKRSRWDTAGVTTSAAVLAAGLIMAPEGRSPFPYALPAVAGTVGLIGFLHHRPQVGGMVRKLLEQRAVVGIGRLSYSLYLWHWPVFVIFLWTVGLDSAPLRLCALVLVFGLAAASYAFVERPFRYGAAIRRAPRPAVIGGGIALALAGAGLYEALDHSRATLTLSTVSRHADEWDPTESWPSARITGCPGRPAVSPVQPIIYSRSGCRTAPPRGRLFVIGDSHALSYITMLREIAAGGDRDVTIYYRLGCGFIDLLPNFNTRNQACSLFGLVTLHDVERHLEPGDVVFLPSLRLPRFSTPFGPANPLAVESAIFGPLAAQARREAESAAIDQLRPLAESGARIVFPAPTPLFRAHAYRCVDWFTRGNPACRGGLTIPRDTMEHLRSPALASLRRIAAAVSGVSVWDPMPVLCPTSVCSAVRDSHPIVFDGDHVSAHSNRLLIRHFEDHLAALR
jgi:peptidoglycan/LPS O-acetylase OafA/YrhL